MLALAALPWLRENSTASCPVPPQVEGIFNTLLEDEELLAQLFSLLQVRSRPLPGRLAAVDACCTSCQASWPASRTPHLASTRAPFPRPPPPLVLQAERPLNCMLAGYFSRVMGSLLLRRTQDIMQYLQRNQGLLGQLMGHVDTTSIAEVLVRLVGADEQRAYLSTNHLQWLSGAHPGHSAQPAAGAGAAYSTTVRLANMPLPCKHAAAFRPAFTETNLLYQLLDKLQPGQPVEAQSNAAEILAALAQSQVSPLARNLAEPEFMELLVTRALRHPGDEDAGTDGAVGGAPVGGVDGAGGRASYGEEMLAGSGSSVMYHALNVCIALVEPLPPSPAEQQATAQALGLDAPPVPPVQVAAAEVHRAMRAQATQCIARSITPLVVLLDAVDEGRQLPTSYGLLQPPVGLARLKAVELLAALLQSGDEAAGAWLGYGRVLRALELRCHLALHRACS